MTNQQAIDILHRQIWQIANQVRGAVDGWDFKQFVLGTLFYRFISEHFINYANGGDPDLDYAGMDDADVPDDFKADAILSEGLFIAPGHLFSNLVKTASENYNLNIDLREAFDAIEASAIGHISEGDLNGIFSDFDTDSNRLGSTTKQKSERLALVLKGVDDLKLEFDDGKGDLFGDAYEFLISKYAANAGKSGGEFFTPAHVSKLIAKLAVYGQDGINSVYDPTVGSGSLLLQARTEIRDQVGKADDVGFFGQEVNYTTYNLARMNMFLHGIDYDKFQIRCGNTLESPEFDEDLPFDAIVSNPPYSVKWKGSDNPLLINDDRFAPAGVLAPKSKADFAFIMHALHYLSARGRAAIVCFPGIFYRGGAEQKIRKYLIENNYIEAVISLAPNLFFGTTIAVNILVLSKNRTDTKVKFINATGDNFFSKGTNNNFMEDDHISRIMEMFAANKDVPHIMEMVDPDRIAANDWNLSVSAYVEPEDTREVIDIVKLNADLEVTVKKIDRLRKEINSIIAEIEA